MLFTDIEGHDRPVAILKRALANDALAHAYLFSGDRGVGKKMTALALAAAVNCRDRRPDGACGVCESCRRIASRTHADVRLIMPESEDEQLLATRTGKQAEKASDEIKIDQIREAQDGISLTPGEGGKKVLIVDGAETLNVAAQNAFLKTLEEPPGNALIILVTSMPQSLLPTIRSRCQELRFQPLPRRVLAQALARKRGLSEDEAWFAAALSNGSMGRGLAMDVAQEKSERDGIKALWSGLGSMSRSEVLVLAEAIAKDRDRLDRLFDIGIEHLRDELVFRETGDRNLQAYAETGRGDAALETISSRQLLGDFDLVAASRKLIDRRVNAQLVTENLLLKLGRK